MKIGYLKQNNMGKTIIQIRKKSARNKKIVMDYFFNNNNNSDKDISDATGIHSAMVATIIARYFKEKQKEWYKRDYEDIDWGKS